MADVGVDVAQWQKTAALLKVADKKVARATRKGLREAVKPIGDEVAREGAEKMPHKGGLSAYLAANAKPTISMTGSQAAIRLQGKSKRGKTIQTKALDAGQLRHPVWGRWRKATPTQEVPAGAYSNAFLAKKDEAVEVVRQAVQDALSNLEGSE